MSVSYIHANILIMLIAKLIDFESTNFHVLPTSYQNMILPFLDSTVYSKLNTLYTQETKVLTG